MHRVLLTAIAVAGLVAVGQVPAHAESDGLPAPSSVTADQVEAYLKKLPPAVWLRVIRQTVRVAGLTDAPVIAIFNTGRDDVVKTQCDGYTLTGTGTDGSVSKWNSGNIPARSVVIEHTNKWDGYCKHAITANTDVGDMVGELDVPGEFSKSTNIILREKR